MADRAPVQRLPSPRQAADDLVASFGELALVARPVVRTCAKVAFAIGDPVDASDEAVQRACIALARWIDDQHAFFDRHAYHHRQHFCEVVLTAHFLCRVHRVPAPEARLVLLGALAHDLEHDGTAGDAFAYERRSVARCAPFLARAGVGEAAFLAVAALVLATDATHGAPVATRIRRWHDAGCVGAPVVTPVPELRALIDSDALSRAAVILCEADVLPSVGLTLTHALQLQDGLAREWGCTLLAPDKARFIDDLVGGGVIGEFFMPNVMEIRGSLPEAVRAA